MMQQKGRLLVLLCALSGVAHGAQQAERGPMDSEWFYNEKHPFAKANALHQRLEWDAAARAYCEGINKRQGSEYDLQKALLNLAACIMAQRGATKYWGFFDPLLDIEPQKLLSADVLADTTEKDKKVLVRTDKVGIGDIFHFLSTIHELKKLTGWDVILSVRKFLKDTIASAVVGYGCKIVVEGEVLPETDYETHIIGLLGHLNLNPVAMNPGNVMFTAQERAINAVSEQVSPVISQGKNILVVVPGVDIPATLIGGKQLPRDPKQRGRHLVSPPFVELLEMYPEIVLMDCGGTAGRITVDEGQKDRYVLIAKEEQAFDTIVALGRIMSLKARENREKNGKVVAIAADCGPANVLARCLDEEAQNNMTFIIPNTAESDMRMQGKGNCYRQMISNCRVMPCLPPYSEAETIEAAYVMMTGFLTVTKPFDDSKSSHYATS